MVDNVLEAIVYCFNEHCSNLLAKAMYNYLEYGNIIEVSIDGLCVFVLIDGEQAIVLSEAGLRLWKTSQIFVSLRCGIFDLADPGVLNR